MTLQNNLTKAQKSSLVRSKNGT